MRKLRFDCQQFTAQFIGSIGRVHFIFPYATNCSYDLFLEKEVDNGYVLYSENLPNGSVLRLPLLTALRLMWNDLVDPLDNRRDFLFYITVAGADLKHVTVVPPSYILSFGNMKIVFEITNRSLAGHLVESIKFKLDSYT